METAGVSAPYAVSSTHFLLTWSSQACCCCNITRSEIDRRIPPKKQNKKDHRAKDHNACITRERERERMVTNFYFVFLCYLFLFSSSRPHRRGRLPFLLLLQEGVETLLRLLLLPLLFVLLPSPPPPPPHPGRCINASLSSLYLFSSSFSPLLLLQESL